MKRVLLVGNHAVFRQAFAWVLDREPNLEVVAHTGSLAEGRAHVTTSEADVALVDLGLPDVDRADLVRELHEAAPPVPMLVLTLTFDPA